MIRDLMFLRKHEYREFLRGPEGFATNILSDRLKRLVRIGLVEKRGKLYFLTQMGKDLLPMMVEMIIWGGTYRAAPDMPKTRFDRIKRNPKKFMQEILRKLKD